MDLFKLFIDSKHPSQEFIQSTFANQKDVKLAPLAKHVMDNNPFNVLMLSKHYFSQDLGPQHEKLLILTLKHSSENHLKNFMLEYFMKDVLATPHGVELRNFAKALFERARTSPSYGNGSFNALWPSHIKHGEFFNLTVEQKVKFFRYVLEFSQTNEMNDYIRGNLKELVRTTTGSRWDSKGNAVEVIYRAIDIPDQKARVALLKEIDLPDVRNAPPKQSTRPAKKPAQNKCQLNF